MGSQLEIDIDPEGEAAVLPRHQGNTGTGCFLLHDHAIKESNIERKGPLYVSKLSTAAVLDEYYKDQKYEEYKRGPPPPPPGIGVGAATAAMIVHAALRPALNFTMDDASSASASMSPPLLHHPPPPLPPQQTRAEAQEPMLKMMQEAAALRNNSGLVSHLI
jgi:hypothetical protein